MHHNALWEHNSTPIINKIVYLLTMTSRNYCQYYLHAVNSSHCNIAKIFLFCELSSLSFQNGVQYSKHSVVWGKLDTTDTTDKL